MSGLDLDTATYLIVTPKYKVRHVARRTESGEWVPICNAHYTANHDRHERVARPPEPHEEDYPVCKRCQAWWKPRMVTV